MSTKNLVVGSQVSLGGKTSVKPYPMHSKENSSSSRSFLFKRHVYSHTERLGLSRLFDGGASDFVQRAFCCFGGKRDVEAQGEEGADDDTRH
jgi:hypothetical protein